MTETFWCERVHVLFFAWFALHLPFVPDLSVFNIKLLPRDHNGEIIYPMIPRIKGSSLHLLVSAVCLAQQHISNYLDTLPVKELEN